MDVLKLLYEYLQGRSRNESFHVRAHTNYLEPGQIMYISTYGWLPDPISYQIWRRAGVYEVAIIPSTAGGALNYTEEVVVDLADPSSFTKIYHMVTNGST